MLPKKTRKHKVHYFVSRQNNIKDRKYSKILQDLGILVLISLNGWQVCCLGFYSSLGISVKYQAITEEEEKKKTRKKRKGIDRFRIDETKTTPKNRQPLFHTCCKAQLAFILYLFLLLLLFYHRIKPAQMYRWNGSCVDHDQTG